MSNFFDSIRRFWLWPTLAVGVMAILWLWPGSFSSNARFMVHGLCAQTPSHTFHIGGIPLPFDARMTGIYAGAFVTLIWMLANQRLLSRRLPPLSVVVVLVGFFLAMAIDGTNSLLTDLHRWHPWTSTNAIRLVTGYVAGVSLAVAIAFVFANTVWRIAEPEPVLVSIRQLTSSLIPLLFIIVVVDTSLRFMYMPFALLLFFGAWAVLTLLMTAALLLATRRDDRIASIHQLHIPVAIGMVIALAVMVLLALGRTLIERTYGVEFVF